MCLGFFQETLELKPSNAIEIGNRRELFIDKYLIESLEGLSLKLHEPKATEPMQQPANDMEYGTIIHDGNLYRMYTREGRGAKFDGDDKEVTRYCESTDGVRWIRPNLGIVELDGSKDNNVILKEAPFCHNFAPFLDENPNREENKRFKALAGTVKSGLFAFESADGIHWSKSLNEPVIQYTKEYAFDSQNVAFWSAYEGMYICYFRHFLDGKLRSICRTTSKDFLHWTEPIPMRPNLPDEHLYTSLTHPYFRAPHIYISTPTRFFPNANNRTDILLMTARGDRPFDRTFRQAWLRPGLGSERWENRANYAAWHIVQTGPEEMSLYTTPFRRFTLRLDGFASVHADADPGLLTTKVFTMTGEKLLVNASTSAAGSIRVELTDPSGKSIEGFGLDDCEPFVGDAIDGRVVWKSKTDLKPLAGKPIRARFELTDADLYAIEFQSENIRQVDFRTDVRPIFEQRCFACHGALKQEAGLRLDTAASILKGSDSGPIIPTERSNKNTLIERISTKETASRMPPEGHSLDASEIQTISYWIDQGARIPAVDSPEPDPKEHWAFQVPTRPAIPNPENAPIHPIDAFLLESLKSKGLTPEPLAEPAIRLRRLHLDLVGLPPSPEELEQFLADPSQTAYLKVVDELLARPEHAERWARHWMDVWRYADWFGRRYVPDVWNSAPQIWRWRDWIVQSLIDDVGYDQMIREMLAADELKPGDPQSNVATGFLIRNWYALNPNDWMRNNVEHASKAFLGLTIHCAHCHDHKYDPITQENYFQLRAFFEPIYVRQDRLAGQADPGPFQDYQYSTLRKVQRLGRVSVYDKAADAPTWFYTGGDERNRQSERGTILPDVPDFLRAAFEQPVQSVSLPPRAWYPGLDPKIIETMLQESDQAVEQAALRKDAAQAALVAANASDQSKSEQKFKIEKVSQIQQQLRDSENQSRSSSHAPLAGQQSLLMDATTGRRMIYRAMPEVTSVQEGDQIRFLVRILADTHFNFQLTRNSSTGATATYVGFENGSIKSYKPASFEEFTVGKFDPDAESTMMVELTLHPQSDQCSLRVISNRVISDQEQTVLVDTTKIALNGWNPVGDPTKGILFDARSGSVAVIDNWSYHPNSSYPSTPAKALIEFDFEPEHYAENSDLVGILGWTSAAGYSIPPACSKVVGRLPSVAIGKLREELASAQRAADRMGFAFEVAKAELVSAQSARSALQARIAAERAKYIEDPKPEQEILDQRSRRACIEESTANRDKMMARWLQANLELADAESKPLEDANRAKEIQTARGQLVQAQSELDAAHAQIQNTQQQTPAQSDYSALSPMYPKTSTGRRSALAAWITSTKNPLTARGGVNHIWMRHFHEPLVKTVFDFGRNGAVPTHRELLDWLAVEWIESKWSMKHLHRLIVTSEAYQRRSSGSVNPSLKQDPENRFYWKMNTGRMEAEVLRDSLLRISGKLDQTMGGQELENKDIFTSWRRTLYYSCQPEEDGKSSLVMLFDGPDASDCYRRTQTVIPQQSLALTNSSLVHELSTLIAQKLESSLSEAIRNEPASFVHAAFRSILSRSPNEKELQLCLEYLKESNDEVTRRSSLIRVLLNHNDFITIR